MCMYPETCSLDVGESSVQMCSNATSWSRDVCINCVLPTNEVRL